MAFDCINNGGRGVKISSDQVTVALYARDGAPYEFALTIGADALKRLHWEAGTQVLLLEGHGTDAGCMKVIPAPAGTRGYTLSKSGNTSSLTTKMAVHKLKHHSYESMARTAIPVTFQAFGSEMLIMLPEWLTPKVAARCGGGGSRHASVGLRRWS